MSVCVSVHFQFTAMLILENVFKPMDERVHKILNGAHQQQQQHHIVPLDFELCVTDITNDRTMNKHTAFVDVVVGVSHTTIFSIRTRKKKKIN